MNAKPILKSNCTACDTENRISYAGGMEVHTCKKCGCVWKKSPQSTRAALLRSPKQMKRIVRNLESLAGYNEAIGSQITAKELHEAVSYIQATGAAS